MMHDAMIAELVKVGFTEDHAEDVAHGILDILNAIGYRPVTKEGYADLLRDSKFLATLESHGVDNWEGWNSAVQKMGNE